MPTILCIETGSNVCSVALGNKQGILGVKEVCDEKAHSSLLNVLINDLCNEKKITLSEIDAVAVSKGPGSYTGLRIGVSMAKGICYAISKPLIAVGSLESMVYGIDDYINVNQFGREEVLLCPMIDARRMEVYTALFNFQKHPLTEVKALVVDGSTFESRLKSKKVVFFGNGAAKCREVISNTNAMFVDDFSPSARFMLPLAMLAYEEKDFKDVAYFEPFYLKNFVAVKGKNKVLPSQK